MLRVVLVGNTVPPDRHGGLPRYVRELATALVRKGCDTTVLAKRVNADSPAIEIALDGVRIVRHAAPSKHSPLFAPAYPLYTARGVLGPMRAMRGPRTVVHAHFAVTALPLVLAAQPFLYTFHAPVWKELLDERQSTYVLPAPAQRGVVAGLRCAERLVISRSRKTFVLSEFMRDELSELSNSVASGAELLAGGIDIRKFAPDADVPRSSSEAALLFTARRLTPRTGVDRLIASMPEIFRAHPKVTLAIAGTGEQDSELQRLAAQLGVAEQIRFLGRVSEDELVRWYRRATLVVMPTVSLEGFGLTTAEALACGAPVVGTPVGATPELLNPLDRSLLARDNTPEGLADAVCRLLANPARLAGISARARARVVPAMGWDAVAGRYIETYEAALAGRAIQNGDKIRER